MGIRSALPEDASGLLAIYREYMGTPVTFEVELPTEEEFRERILSFSEKYPYLVYEENGRMLGYAYAHRLFAREAYQWGAELSVYLDMSAQGKGIGTQLYTELIRALAAMGVRTVYGVVTSPNPASEHLHEKFGFRLIGTFRNAGYKNGRWHDVLWYEKQIGPYEKNPAKI